MITGISTASNAVSTAFAAYEGAVGAVVSAAGDDTGAPAAAGDLAGAIVEMDSSAVGLAAVIVAARASNEMLTDAIDSGKYWPLPE